jgi:hypothetical protein
MPGPSPLNARQKTQEQRSHGLHHAFRQRPNHTKIDEFDDGTIAWRALFDKDVARVWVCMEEALIEELVKVGLHRAIRHLQAVNACCLQCLTIVDLDAINPLQDQHTTRGKVIIRGWNVDSGTVTATKNVDIYTPL